MELLDLLLHEAEVLAPRKDLAVREQAGGAGKMVHPVAHRRRLVAGEVHRRCSDSIDAAPDGRRSVVGRLEQAERRVAQEATVTWLSR